MKSEEQIREMIDKIEAILDRDHVPKEIRSKFFKEVDFLRWVLDENYEN